MIIWKPVCNGVLGLPHANLQELNVILSGILQVICETLSSLKSALVEVLHHGIWQMLQIRAFPP